MSTFATIGGVLNKYRLQKLILTTEEQKKFIVNFLLKVVDMLCVLMKLPMGLTMN